MILEKSLFVKDFCKKMGYIILQSRFQMSENSSNTCTPNSYQLKLVNGCWQLPAFTDVIDTLLTLLQTATRLNRSVRKWLKRIGICSSCWLTYHTSLYFTVKLQHKQVRNSFSERFGWFAFHHSERSLLRTLFIPRGRL